MRKSNWIISPRGEEEVLANAFEDMPMDESSILDAPSVHST